MDEHTIYGLLEYARHSWLISSSSCAQCAAQSDTTSCWAWDSSSRADTAHLVKITRLKIALRIQFASPVPTVRGTARHSGLAAPSTSCALYAQFWSQSACLAPRWPAITEVITRLLYIVMTYQDATRLNLFPQSLHRVFACCVRDQFTQRCK